MTDSEPWTIKRLLDWTKDYFGRHDSDSPRLEAEVLLAEALGCARIDLYTRFNEVPDETGLGVFRAWVKRRVAGEPVAYLVGHREFYSLRFKVNSDVLIPRPETEHVVIAAIDCAKKLNRSVSIVDVGTGSGCIAVALGKHVDECEIVAIDFSPAALDVARENAASHHVDGKIEFIESDLFESVAPKQFDLVVSNPPYIGTAEEGTLSPQVKEHEPHLALFSGATGLDLTRRLVEACDSRLVSGGYLIFETSPIVIDQCIDIVNKSGLFAPPSQEKDLANHPRVVIAQRI